MSNNNNNPFFQMLPLSRVLLYLFLPSIFAKVTYCKIICDVELDISNQSYILVNLENTYGPYCNPRNKFTPDAGIVRYAGYVDYGKLLMRFIRSSLQYTMDWPMRIEYRKLLSAGVSKWYIDSESIDLHAILYAFTCATAVFNRECDGHCWNRRNGKFYETLRMISRRKYVLDSY